MLILAFGITGSALYLGVLTLVWGSPDLLAVSTIIGLPQLVISQAILRRSGGWSAGHTAGVLILFCLAFVIAVTAGLVWAANSDAV